MLRGFGPLMLLASLVAVLVSRHADFVRTSAIGAAILAGVSWAWRLPGDGMAKEFAVAIAKLLAKRGTAIALWAAVGLATLASFFVASLHVEAAEAPARPVWLIRVVESADAPGVATKVDSVELDHRHLHRDFYIFPSTSRRVWLMTSENERTDPGTFYPWKTLTVGYKDQFKPVVAATFLPWQSFLAVMGKGRPLFVRIVDETTGELLAADSLVNTRAMPSLMLSFAGAPDTVDATTAARWLRLAQLDAGGDTAAAASMARDWSTPHWVPAQRDLVRGHRLRIVLLKANGDTAGTDTLTLQRNFSDAVVRRRS